MMVVIDAPPNVFGQPIAKYLTIDAMIREMYQL